MRPGGRVFETPALYHHASVIDYIPNFIEIEETFCGRTDERTNARIYGRTDGRTDI